ncbi:tryptophan-rich sensory protein [Cnuibacter physcomitrellae]|uniref:tryptophan-rich sensory protein n=1 Tax=Cnuibacter physcomitrellae TaxID=1619308 RepID=UPI002175E929|nr:tryptophan-rich sensory protein [Cnuibacter physcomitrellae]MCS5499010.1 tryptophan-rich sensory protein [Cnuibacter physcomitrellae]
MRYSNDSVTRADRVRQVGVVICAALALVGAFVGSGAAGGTPIAEAAGGALSADSTMVAPAGPAFSIWSVIYVGLIAYAVYQALPGRAADPLLRSLGIPVIASLLLNAAWILSVQFDALWLSVPLIVLLLISLLWILGVLRRRRPGVEPSRSPAQALLVDGVFGLYLGWVTIATVANIAAALTAAGFAGAGLSPEAWGVALLVVAGLLGVGLLVWSRGRMAALLSLGWGVAWIGVSRTTGSLVAPPVATTAFVVAGALLVLAIGAAVLTGLRFARSRRRAA